MFFRWFQKRRGPVTSAAATEVSREVLLAEVRALVSEGLNAAAEARFEGLAARFSDDASIRNELGAVRYALGDFAGAEAVFREAVSLAPRDAAAHANLGQSLQARGLFDLALPQFEAALRIDPGHEFARFNLALACCALGDRRRACAVYCDLIASSPDDVSVHTALADCLLAMEDFEAGWREYEWRFKVADFTPYFRAYSQPLWDGSEQPGACLLVWPEQGYGDTLQFMRLARHTAEKMPSMQVIIEVPPALLRLTRYSYADCANLTVAESSASEPAFTCHVSVMSLAHLLRQRLTENPIAGPYLKADPTLVARWMEHLAHAAAGQVKIGLVWASSRRQQLGFAVEEIDRRRSIGAEPLAVLLDVPGCLFVNLQTGARSAEMAMLGRELVDFSGELADFADTAALIVCLDLVVTVDTAVAHLAGALGKPVWMLSRYDACWRWGARRADIPWYPTLRPFYQPRPAAWEPVVEDVRRALQELVQQHAEHG